MVSVNVKYSIPFVLFASARSLQGRTLIVSAHRQVLHRTSLISHHTYLQLAVGHICISPSGGHVAVALAAGVRAVSSFSRLVRYTLQRRQGPSESTAARAAPHASTGWMWCLCMWCWAADSAKGAVLHHPRIISLCGDAKDPMWGSGVGIRCGDLVWGSGVGILVLGCTSVETYANYSPPTIIHTLTALPVHGHIRTDQLSYIHLQHYLCMDTYARTADARPTAIVSSHGLNPLWGVGGKY